MPSSPQTVTTRGVFDYLYNSAGKAIVGATVNCTLNFNGGSVTSPIVNLGELQQSTITDQNGFWRFNLVPNDTITPTGTLYSINAGNIASYDISVPSGGADVQSSSILANTPSVLSPALTGLTGPITVTGNETVTGTLGVTGATTLGQLTAGSTTLGATNTGALTTAAQTVGGDLTISSAFRLLFGATVAKIIPGATSISHRNNADSADNLLITDAGTVTARLEMVAPDLKATGLTGAANQTRLAGATAAGAPTAGTFAVDDIVTDQNGNAWVCTVAGTPGTWRRADGWFGIGSPQQGAGVTLNSRILCQAGSTVVTTDTGGGADVTYPVAFPNGVLCVLATPGDNSASLAQVTQQLSSATLAKFHVITFNQTGAVENTQNVRINWLAIGF